MPRLHPSLEQRVYRIDVLPEPGLAQIPALAMLMLFTQRRAPMLSKYVSVAQPRTRRYTIMSVLINISGILMSVRTEDTRFINRAFTLASSRCPKPGSVAPAVQPTATTRQFCPLSIVSRSVWDSRRATSNRLRGRGGGARGGMYGATTYCVREIGLRKGWLSH